MGEAQHHPPCALFFGLLLSEGVELSDDHSRLEDGFSKIHVCSDLWPFEQTDHYEPEMGPNLRRQFVAMDRAFDPGYLASMKHRANAIEQEFAEDGARRVNIDPGYVALDKVVLASTKNHAHRVYLADGIFGEVTLSYHRGKGYEPWPWTYPDYREERVRAWFNALRTELR